MNSFSRRNLEVDGLFSCIMYLTREFTENDNNN